MVGKYSKYSFSSLRVMSVGNGHTLPLPENIRDSGHPQVSFFFTRLADFRDLGRYRSAPWFSCSVAGGERCVSCRDAGHFVFLSVTSLPFRCTLYQCEQDLSPSLAFILVEPSNTVCGKMKQLIPPTEKYKSWFQGYAWELILNVKTYWGSQLFFGSLGLILEFLQPVTFCKASSWYVACNCSARKKTLSD